MPPKRNRRIAKARSAVASHLQKKVRIVRKRAGIKRTSVGKPKKVVGSGSYSFRDFGNDISRPFLDDTPSQSTTNKIARGIGQIAGEGLGIPFAGKALGNAGSWLARAFGFGDYTLTSNSLMTPTQSTIAQFKTHGTIEFAHREYVMDISSTTGFSNSSYILNPANSTLFPWLSKLAVNFEQYQFLGLIFEFKSTSASAVGSVNTGLGTVIMATDYDVLDEKYVDKRSMEVSEFSTSAAPYKDQIHPIECDPKQNVMKTLFIQKGNSASSYPDDPRFSALGNFQIATAGMQAVSTIGELWVSYHVRLLKPQLEANNRTRVSAQVSTYTAAGGAAFHTLTRSSEPGALTADITTSGPPAVRITCASSSGIGSYSLMHSIIGNAADPVYSATTAAYQIGGQTELIPMAQNSSGYLARSILYSGVASQKAYTNYAVDNHPCEVGTIFTFMAIGDYIDVRLTYSVSASVFHDTFLAPFDINLYEARVARSSKDEISDIRAQLENLMAKQKTIQKDVQEIQAELEDDDICQTNSVVSAMISTLQKESVESYTLSQCQDRIRNLKEALEFSDISSTDRDYLNTRLRNITVRNQYLSTLNI